MCNTIVMINICMCNYMILRSCLFHIDNASESNVSVFSSPARRG
jgi:hypothetical protein